MVDVLLSPLCLHCGQPLGVARPGVCEDCRRLIDPLAGEACRRCDLPRPGRPLDCARCHAWPAGCSAAAATRYGGVAETIVHGLKYGGWRHLAEVCAQPMAARLLGRIEPPDVFVPVPLHATRLRARGYNQAELLAEAVARRCRRPVVNALARTSATASQVGLSRTARWANVADAFVALPRLDRGVHVGLVDDVATSGATLAAAAGALLAAGADRVTAITFALAPDSAGG